MVDARSLGDVIAQVGAGVSMHGYLDRRSQANGALVWAVNAWEPTRRQQVVGGGVPVSWRPDADVPAGGSLVAVTGRWTGVGIDDARGKELFAASIPALISGRPDAMTPQEAGVERFLAVGRSVAGSGATVLGTGATDAAQWVHVLAMTPDLARVQRESPVRLDVFVSVVPSSRPG
ncbi:hypothetical protein K8F61_16390 [Microbacterium resistens]|uniref:Uncharacterized protein n=1 Tax=Microbacterium resistens TaxID=156977 RepID=A0ABY3RTH3_9MICO|nr:hypothetical protein [Microbacterium resistens]UGS26194.1 hypothetical protein K8F61_16390 [Microbacterium resistens]